MYTQILLKPVNPVECIIQERKSRFTVEVLLDNKPSPVYLNNTGRLTNILVKGRKGYCIPNKTGKLKYRLIAVEKNQYAYLVDTSLQEKAFVEAVKQGHIPWLENCILVKRNYKLNGEVVDYAFNCSGRLVLVELKSAVMELPGGLAGYPDAPTQRGWRQLSALAKYVESGGSGIVVFIAGVPFSTGFKLYCSVDREIKKYIDRAISAGVVFRSVNIFYNPDSNSIILGNSDLPIDLNCYLDDNA